MTKLFKYFLLIFIIVLNFPLEAKTIYFVKTDGNGDGSSWSNAANNIQSMINQAVTGDEVWVAFGSYFPTTETISRDSRSRTFLLKDGVNLYGGFIGTETLIGQRVLSDLDKNGKIEPYEFVNKSILNGDIDGILDVWTKNMNQDGKTWNWNVVGNEGNSYRVVSSNNVSSASNYLDGFSVINGNANNSTIQKGGGIYALTFNISNCTVSYCSSQGDCGGIYSGINVTNCKVNNCRSNAGSGGGIIADNVINCTVENCSASGSGGGIFSSNVDKCNISDCSSNSSGGGISISSYNYTANNCVVNNCVSINNGGGIYSDYSVNNCIVNNCNSTSGYGGGISSSKSVTNCTVYNCSSKYYGGGIYSSSNIYKVYNCTVSFCKGNFGGGIYASSAEECVVSNCSSTYDGGGILVSGDINFTFNPTFVKNCKVSNCNASRDGGGIFVRSTTKAYSNSIINCKVSKCTASGYGGGIYSASYNYYSYITNCFVDNCFSTIGGGGIFSSTSSLNYDSKSCIQNCVVQNCSTSGSGGGIFAYSTLSNDYLILTQLENCTVSNCSAINLGGGIFFSSLKSSIYNSIVYNCSSSLNEGGGIYVQNQNSTVSNCAIGNNYSNNILSNIYGGIQTGNTSPDINDEFVKPTSFIGKSTSDDQLEELIKSNWHLKKGSSCINAGVLTFFDNNNPGNEVDIDGTIRIQYSIIDIGAYEYTIPVVPLPAVENFDNWTDFTNSSLLFKSVNLFDSNNIKWEIINQKNIFTWKSNFTTSYNQPFFTCKLDATKATKVFLFYNLYYEAYTGSISPLGTEKLSVDFSTDLQTWTPITSYSNLNGSISDKKYTHDISTIAAGKSFFIRFNANGANSNRIEKWEIDNIQISDQLYITETLENKLNNLIIIHPNPVSESFQINGIDETVTIKLTDISGRTMLSKQVFGNEQIFVSTLPKGLYILKICTNKREIERKIVKK